MEMTGAEIIIGLLERQGIRIIPGIPGGANLPLYDAMSRQHTIRHILARHEQGAGFIAQGMARIAGTPQVCFATSGPGATNTITALADAKLDSIPLVCITGQVPNALIGTDAFQEVDAYGLSLPITKHSYLAKSARHLIDVVPEAFRIAASGRPGPVWIDVPKDVQMQKVSFDAWPPPGRPDAPPPVNPHYIAHAADMIAEARKPVLYIGGGVITARAAGIVVDLAEKASIPVAMTLMGLGAIPKHHPLCLGMLGMHAARPTNFVLEDCDLLIAVGVRFDDRATGRADAFCPRAKVLHIDIDPCEVNKLRTANLGIVGDVREALVHLLPLVPQDERRKWLDEITDTKKKYDDNDSTEQVPPAMASRIITCASQLLDSDATVVTDVGQHQMWTAQHYPFSCPGQFLTSGGLGTMGFGLPTAIGAALMRPAATVVCFSGDGSILMNLQEMATAVEENINIKIVLMNNNALGLVHQQQKLFYGNRVYASKYRFPTDYVTIARGFGLKTFSSVTPEAFEEDFAFALEETGPCLLHVTMDMQDMVFPMVPPGAANTEMIGEDVRSQG